MLPRAACAMKTRTERRDCCAPAVSNGCGPAAESGMEVALANRDGRVASSFGSPCRPSLSWGHPRASTWHQRSFPKTGQRVAFRPSNAAIEFEAQSDAEFVLGSAIPHDYDLVLGSHSVHTSAEALREAEARISAIQTRLIRQGRL